MLSNIFMMVHVGLRWVTTFFSCCHRNVGGKKLFDKKFLCCEEKFFMSRHVFVKIFMMSNIFWMSCKHFCERKKKFCVLRKSFCVGVCRFCRKSEKMSKKSKNPVLGGGQKVPDFADSPGHENASSAFIDRVFLGHPPPLISL